MFLLPLPSSLFPAPVHGETEHAFQINAHILKNTHTMYKLVTTQTEKTLASKVSYTHNTHTSSQQLMQTNSLLPLQLKITEDHESLVK